MILSFGVVLLAAILISGIAHRTVLSTAVLFLAAGFLLGQGMVGVLALQAGDDQVSGIAQVALFVVLFTDGQRLSIRDLTKVWRLPGRALLLGMPLTFAITALLGVWLVGLPWLEALLIAAVLAPTDPVFASAIVGRIEIPERVRGLLNVESGLNDGLALPVVLILVAAIGGPQVDPVVLSLELVGGIVLGIIVPLLVTLLLRIRYLAATPLYASLGPAAIAIIIYGVAVATGANLYLAAFSAGITIASASPELRDAFIEYGEYIAEIVKLLAIFVFGALIAPSVLADVSPLGYLFAVLTIVIARPLAVEIALLGSKLPWEERATASWFGPKGFASVLYGLLVLDSGNADADHLFHLIVVVISLSIIAHSSTDVPIAGYFARLEKKEAARNLGGDHNPAQTR
ncbi:cation:proton antiporter [Cryobacterium sp. GrIS_2_6]|uniref:cation:proton antiporter n=1 Tax=Cryobacterium sp. GrIS_2_6 TaxID=3162785 RepID=UPI002E01DE9A|nr:cation:proton antiporter [Cryobacterium psychrotolerans]MEC5148911.1 NhaP-type Na+/H+ or K+/H+ antiporter [Cryobacterium psychrotolerans]